MADTKLDPYKEPEYRIQKIVGNHWSCYRIYTRDTDNVWRRYGKHQFSEERLAKMHAEIYLDGYTQLPTKTRREFR